MGSITVANDETIIRLIESAEERRIVLARALNRKVAAALGRHWREMGPARVSVILDVDPEVYRVGQGEMEALSMLEQVGADLKTMLQREPGMRIGLVVSDAAMLVYRRRRCLSKRVPRLVWNSRSGR